MEPQGNKIIIAAVYAFKRAWVLKNRQYSLQNALKNFSLASVLWENSQQLFILTARRKMKIIFHMHTHTHRVKNYKPPLWYHMNQWERLKTRIKKGNQVRYSFLLFWLNFTKAKNQFWIFGFKCSLLSSVGISLDTRLYVSNNN